MRATMALAALLVACGPAVTRTATAPSAPPWRDDYDPTTTTTAASVPVLPQERPAPVRAARSSPGRSSLNWAALRQCESGGNYSTDTGNGYFGAYQFSLGTWRSVGGVGNPAHASPAEQDHRARLLYESRGRQPWPVCGSRL